MRLHFATLFDKHYLGRGLVLFNSIKKYVTDFDFYVLALDNEVQKYFEENPDPSIKLVSLSQIEERYPELIEAKNNRNKVEYYFTLSPVLPLFLLETNPDLSYITTLDADICFFSSPVPLFEKFEKYSIMITAHDFDDISESRLKYGKYNVSFQSFRNDEIGVSCLKQWKSQCIEWCFDVLDGNRYADQKYLDSWVEEFKSVMVLDGPALGRAPWNANKYAIESKSSSFVSNDTPLVFYHFHGLRIVGSRAVKMGLSMYEAHLSSGIAKLYKTYILNLKSTAKSVEEKSNTTLRMAESLGKNDILKLLNQGEVMVILFNQFGVHSGKVMVKWLTSIMLRYIK